ncbi:MAG TPA: zf-HC2 domain-containing protein [Actinomycetota bacterium]|nr:zf-HC2 domain-containing protein [Actinomycetota bacterium]
MNPEPHRQWRELLGSFALGNLTSEERAALEEHLEGCAECRSEAAELAQVAALLPAASVDMIEDQPTPPVDLEDRVLSHVRGVQFTERRRRRWRLGAVAGVAAAVVSVFAVVVLRPGEPPAPTGPEQVAFQSLPPGAEVTAELTSHRAATEIKIKVRRMPPGEYVVSMERADGTVVEGDSFQAPSGSWSGRRELAVPRDEAVAVTLTQVGGSTEVRAPLPPV